MSLRLIHHVAYVKNVLPIWAWIGLFCIYIDHIFLILFFNFTILYWFCHISTWIRHREEGSGWGTRVYLWPHFFLSIHRPNGHLSCFNLLAIVSNVALSIEAQISFWVSAFNYFGRNLKVGFLGQTVILFLRFWEITVVPFYVIQSSPEKFNREDICTLHIFSLFFYLSIIYGNRSMWSQPPWGRRLTDPKISSQQAEEPWELMFQLTLRAGKTHCLRSQAVR